MVTENQDAATVTIARLPPSPPNIHWPHCHGLVTLANESSARGSWFSILQMKWTRESHKQPRWTRSNTHTHTDTQYLIHTFIHLNKALHSPGHIKTALQG